MTASLDADEVLFLRDQGVPMPRIAEQLGVTIDGIEKAVRRGRGTCTECGHDWALRVNGTLRVHGRRGGDPGNCPGSLGRPADPPPEIPQPAAAVLDRGEHWRERAACADPEVDPEMFFAGEPGPAVDVCGRCGVQSQCLEWALLTHVEFGVFGGLTPSQRRGLKSS